MDRNVIWNKGLKKTQGTLSTGAQIQEWPPQRWGVQLYQFFQQWPTTLCFDKVGHPALAELALLLHSNQQGLKKLTLLHRQTLSQQCCVLFHQSSFHVHLHFANFILKILLQQFLLFVKHLIQCFPLQPKLILKWTGLSKPRRLFTFPENIARQKQ